MTRSLIAFLATVGGFGLFLSASAQTQAVVSGGPTDMAVTVYPDNLAMITERRTIDLPAGRSRIALAGVNDQIIPETALLTEFGAMSIERNFDYDLLTKQALFENSVGEEVTLIRTLPGNGDVSVERATVVSGGQGVVFQIGDRIESYQCSGLAERVQFDGRPSRFQSEPTLSLTVDAEEAGPQTIEFRYLATGFQWRADYIMRLNSRSAADLNAWLTMSNNTGVDVSEADVSVVAGTVARLDETSAPLIQADVFFANCLPEQPQAWEFQDGGFASFGRLESIVVTAARRQSPLAETTPIAEREDLGDYKLYRAPFATTLAARQTKQIAFLNAPRVRYKKFYAFDFTDFLGPDLLVDSDAIDPDAVVMHSEERYIVDNSRRGRLAEPLPAGVVRVMERRGNEELFFSGQDTIENLPVGARVEIDSGYSGEVVLMRETLAKERVQEPNGRFQIVRDLEYTFINTTNRRVSAEMEVLLELEQSISETSIAPVEEAPVTRWQFDIPANGTRALTFKFVSNY